MARSVGMTAATRRSRPWIVFGSWRAAWMSMRYSMIGCGPSAAAGPAGGGPRGSSSGRPAPGGGARGGGARAPPPRPRGERRPQAADDGLEAVLVGHQGVRVALDDDRLLRLAHGPLGAVDEVERAALVEEERGRGVEVLRAAVRALARRAEDAAAEPARAAGGVADGKDDAAAEAVVDPVAAAPDDEAGALQLLVGRVALRLQGLRHRVPGVGSVAELVGVDRGAAEAAVLAE